MATITDTVGPANMGKTMGIISPIFLTGALFGPVIGGLLLSSVGYWRTWIAPMAMISLDLTLRLVMIDKPKVSNGEPGADEAQPNEVSTDTGPCTIKGDEYSGSSSAGTSVAPAPHPKLSLSRPSSTKSSILNTAPTPSSTAEEAAPLLPTASDFSPLPSPIKPLSEVESFRYILRQRRIISSFFITFTLAIAHNSFGATLALHVQDVFHWGPRQVGFLFLALVAPSVMLGPLAGWLRDAIGVWWPTLAGTGMATPLFVLIGYVGDERFDWMQGEYGKGICVGALLLMGIAIELSECICTIEGARTFFVF